MAAVSNAPSEPGLLALSKRERVEALRRQMATIPGRTFEASPVAPVGDREDEWPASRSGGSALRVLPVPAAVAELLPHRGLARGSVVSVSGARSVLVSILASVTAAGSHAAIIGEPRLGLLAAVELGADLRKLSVIADAGSEPVDVAAILADGMGFIVLGLGGAAVSPSRARAVTARLRTKGAVLAVTGGRWPGTDVHIATRVVGVSGLGMGRGRVQGIRVEVAVTGRGFQSRSRQLELTATDGHVGWAPSTPVSARHWLPEAL